MNYSKSSSILFALTILNLAFLLACGSPSNIKKYAMKPIDKNAIGAVYHLSYISFNGHKPNYTASDENTMVFKLVSDQRIEGSILCNDFVLNASWSTDGVLSTSGFLKTPIANCRTSDLDPFTFASVMTYSTNFNQLSISDIANTYTAYFFK